MPNLTPDAIMAGEDKGILVEAIDKANAERPPSDSHTHVLNAYWDDLETRMDAFVDKHPPYGPRTCTDPDCRCGSWDPAPIQGALF